MVPIYCLHEKERGSVPPPSEVRYCIGAPGQTHSDVAQSGFSRTWVSPEDEEMSVFIKGRLTREGMHP
jgi:hypothetical protein